MTVISFPSNPRCKLCASHVRLTLTGLAGWCEMHQELTNDDYHCEKFKFDPERAKVTT